MVSPVGDPLPEPGRTTKLAGGYPAETQLVKLT